MLPKITLSAIWTFGLLGIKEVFGILEELFGSTWVEAMGSTPHLWKILERM
jgi:hypothetical protein